MICNHRGESPQSYYYLLFTQFTYDVNYIELLHRVVVGIAASIFMVDPEKGYSIYLRDVFSVAHNHTVQ